jgi:hypothetical protein
MKLTLMLKWIPLIACLFPLASAPVFGQPESAPVPQLDERQIAQVRELVQTTQPKLTLLQARLGERQRELARVYARYELDETKARTLQEEIIELQRQLLASHHQMQIRLRTIVGRERFDFLRRRLEQAVSFDPSATAPSSGNSAKEANPQKHP